MYAKRLGLQVPISVSVREGEHQISLRSRRLKTPTDLLYLSSFSPEGQTADLWVRPCLFPFKLWPHPDLSRPLLLPSQLAICRVAMNPCVLSPLFLLLPLFLFSRSSRSNPSPSLSSIFRSQSAIPNSPSSSLTLIPSVPLTVATVSALLAGSFFALRWYRLLGTATTGTGGNWAVLFARWAGALAGVGGRGEL